MSPTNKAHFESEKEAINLILTGNGDEIYLTIDAYQTAHEMWEAIERYKGKEIAKLITPPFESTFEEDSDPEQAQRDKDMQKNLALIAKYFKKIYKPTNNNLRTSSNSRNKNVDTTLWYKNDNQSGQFGNQRTMNVAEAKENVGSPVVQQSGIQCFNCKEFGHFAKECRMPKRVKDFAYHKEKMLMCKQAEKGLPLQAEQYDWLADTDEEIDEQELEVHYSYMAKIQEVPTADTCTGFEPLEQNDQNDVKSNDERVALANLIANLKLDTEFEKYKAFNDCTVDYDKLERKLNETLGQLAQKDIKIKEGLKLKAYEISVVKQKHDELIKHSLLTKSHYEGLFKQKTKVITDLKLKEEHDIDKMFSTEKQLKFLNEIVYKRIQSIYTIHTMAPKVPTYNGRHTFANPRYLKQAQSEIPCLYTFPYDQSTHANRFILDGEETLALEKESQSKLNKDSEIVNNAWVKHTKDQFHAPTAKDMEILIQTCLMPLALKTQNDSFIFVHELKKEMYADLKYVESLEKEIDELVHDKAKFSNMYDMILQEFDSDHFACVTKMLNDVNARTKKPNVVPISTRKPKGHVNESVATFHKKKVASKSTTQKPKSYYRMLNEKSKLIIFILDSGCTKHMTGNLKLLCNFVEKYLGTIRFRNYQFAQILGYGDLVQGNITINRVYYIEGLNHNLFSVVQFCDANLKVAFQKSTCFDRDLLRLSHLNFDYINLLSNKDVVIGLPKLKFVKDQLCSSYELSKAKRSSFKSNVVPSLKGRLNLLHIDLCGPMQVASINGKKYILVIVDDYSRYTWTLFLCYKDETPEVLKEFLTMIQRNLQAPVITARTDRGTEFLNKTLHAFFKEE
nr:hypothetical protein [Tanacetum cinerariifolium]